MPPPTDAIRFFEQLGETYGRQLAKTLQPRRNEVRGAPTRPTSPKRALTRPARARRSVVAGAIVRYRQGRGTFEAEVIRVDQVSQMATLQRTLDGKRVLRPLDRVYA